VAGNLAIQAHIPILEMFCCGGHCHKLDGNVLWQFCVCAYKTGFACLGKSLTTFLVRPSTGAQQGHEQAPRNIQMTLKDQSFICVHS
jgi:hypothetical protein